MLPEHLTTEALADLLRHDLNLPADFAASNLTVEHIAQVATLAAAQTTGHAATGHLLELIAALPIPTGDNPPFWRDLWRTADTAYLLPANIKHLVLRALGGDGAGLAGQLLDAFNEITPERREAVAQLIGEALAESSDIGGSKHTKRYGELWLRDVELTAWRVLYAARRGQAGPEERDAFREAWKSV